MRDMPFVVPPFSRLTDFVGMWAMEPTAAAVLMEQVRRVDLAALAAQATAVTTRAGSTMDYVEVKGEKRVAVVRAVGSLMKPRNYYGTSTMALRQDIQAAANDKSVSGILLAVESPGGTVAGTMDLAAEVALARRKKPVWAHVDDLAASAAYWMVSQADQVWANNGTALIGSVGTIFSVLDTSGAAEKEGVKMRVFATGPLKATGYAGTPLNEEQAAMIQGLADQTQKFFDAGVKAGRRLSPEQMAAVQTGATFTAVRAKEVGLIDGIRPFSATLAALADAK